MFATMQKGLLKSVLAAAMMVVAMGAAQAAVTVKHAKGELTLKETPKKVIVFDLAILDTMKVLGVKASGVPELKYPANLSEYTQVTKIGTLFEPDYEKIMAAKPDLIIISGRAAPKYDQLSKIAPTLDLTVDTTKLLDSVRSNTLTLGQVFDKEAQAKAALADLDKSIADLKAKASKAGSGMFVMAVGNKISAYGPGSRFGVIHDEFGVKPAVADLKVSNHGQAASFEYLYKANPQWLFVIDRDTAIGTAKRSPQQALDNELMRKTDAWKNNRIVYLDSSNWYVLGNAGLTALKENIAQLDKVFSAK